MLTCHACRQPWNAHRPDCRVLSDIARLRRVHDRLAAEGRDEALRGKIAGYLNLFGRLPCQGRAAMPVDADCERCGHKEVCVILPEAA